MQLESAPRDIRVLLFDVGGVLVELSGIEIMLEWLGNTITADEMWRRWLRSASVREFETGQIDAGEFAIRATREFEIAVSPQQFLESFIRWPIGLYPGTLEMLAQIPNTYQRAILSNTNALHWPRVLSDMKLGGMFDSHFVSHLTGRIKPDSDAFEHVVTSLGCLPAQVLFLDDNLLNIEAAQSIGMHAMRVQGPAEAQRVLTDFGILVDTHR
jgi:HAD superfamily hydrolase (TIGR01509 family)